MDRERFEALVAAGVKQIPARFLKKIKNVAIIVEDEPTMEKLLSVGVNPKSNQTLLGLYEGVSELEGGHTYRTFPDRITIFRLPILSTARTEEDVSLIVAATVRHEIAHHFGMNEFEVRRAERRESKRGK